MYDPEEMDDAMSADAEQSRKERAREKLLRAMMLGQMQQQPQGGLLGELSGGIAQMLPLLMTMRQNKVPKLNPGVMGDPTDMTGYA